MKLGISSYTYGWAVGVPGHMPETPMGLEDLIEQARAFGLTLLQVGDNLPLDRLPRETLQQARAALERYGIELEIGIRGLLDDRIEKYIELCRFFSAKLLRVVVDEGSYEPSEEEIIATLQKWVPALISAGITLGIENHDRLKAMQLARILRLVNSPAVGICLDTANSLGALEGLETVLDALVPYTVNLHAKDISIHRLPSQQGFQITGTASGEGLLNIMALVERVSRNGREVNCILEQWTPFTDTLEKTIQLEAADATRGVNNLREILQCAGQISDKLSVGETLFPCEGDSEILLQRVSKGGKPLYQACFPHMGALVQWNGAAADSLRRQCASLGILVEQIYAVAVSQLIASEREKLSCEEQDIIGRLLTAAKEIPGCKEIVVPLGKLNIAAEGLTISQMKRIEDNYFWNLAEFTRACGNEGFCVGFHLLPGGFVDSGAILLREMCHNNINQVNIYSS